MAGYGNHRAPSPQLSSPSPSSGEDALMRFDTQSTHGSAPYTNAHTHGSALTAGAGWGNKTSASTSTSSGSGVEAKEAEAGGSGDSLLGKVMQKAGGVLHSSSLQDHGEAKRVGAMRN